MYEIGPTMPRVSDTDRREAAILRRIRSQELVRNISGMVRSGDGRLIEVRAADGGRPISMTPEEVIELSNRLREVAEPLLATD